MIGTDLEKIGNTYARVQIWSHDKNQWVVERPANNVGKLVSDTAERVLMIDPASDDLPKTTHGILSCSIQGQVNTPMLKTTRPDLIK